MSSHSGTVKFQTATANPDLEIVSDIQADELSKAIAAAQAPLHIIDVRMPEEYNDQLGHIAESELIPLPTLPEHLERLPKDQTVVFVCRSGGRSARAAAFALSNGYEHVYNMVGGMIRWNELHLPVQR